MTHIGVTGPEVIEINKGADVYAADTFAGFRAAIAQALNRVPRFEAATLRAENARLRDRLKRFEGCDAAVDIWRTLGVPDPAGLQDMPDDAFIAIVKQHGVIRHDAR